MSGGNQSKGRAASARWLAAALAGEVAVALVDGLSGEDTIFTTGFLLPVLALALVERERPVSIVAVLACVLALLSGIWDDYFLSADHIVRVGIVAVGSVLAVLSARMRERAEADRGRMERLAEVSRISDAPDLAAALERLGDVTVPAVADLCWVDLEEEGELRRAFARGPAELEPGGTVIPLRIREQEIGRLGFAVGPPRRPYDRDDRAFFAVLAGRVALALANTRLLAELSHTRERLDRILGSLAEAVTVHDTEGRMVYANAAAVELLGAESMDALLEAEPGELAQRFVVHNEDGKPVSAEQYPGRKLLAGDPDPPPMLSHSVHRDSGREYWLLTKATLLFEDDGSPLAVNVIEDVTDTKEAELRQRFLDQAGQVLASSLEYERVLQRVAELAVPWLADCCAVDLRVSGSLERVAATPDGASFDDVDVEAVVRSGVALRQRTSVVVPMVAGDEVLGAMTFGSGATGRTFDDDDFVFAQDLARRAATAVQNGRLYAEQVRVAHTLQRSLLPDRLPDVPGWEAGASYEAGDVRAEVGGDFYDIVPAETGHFVFLGDVTGKGVEAAALTALVRHSAQMAARFAGRPSDVLAIVNGVLREQQRLAPVSVICALVERGAPRVTLASAGHPLPLLKRAGQAPREVGAHDVLLGVVTQDRFAEETIDIEPGDVLVFFTDGVTDAPGAEERFGEERLLAAVAGAPADPSAMLHTIEAALRAFVSGEGADDRAMLALRYTGARSDASGRGAPGTPMRIP